MKYKTTIAIILGVFLLSFASAMYAGECEQLDLGDLESLENVVYTSVGNQSNLEGLNITLNGIYVDICPALNYKPDNFTLLFWDDTSEVKEVVIYRRGGSKTRYIDRNITEYIDVEKIIYINQTIDWIPKMNNSIDEWAEWEIKEEIGFFEKIWNWIKNLFVNEVIEE